MATLAQTLADRPKPLAVLTLEPSAFRSRPPKSKVALGLRLMGQGEVMTAQAEAWKEARAGEREGEAVIERFNEALLCWVVAAVACDPNDADKAFFQFADIEVRERLTPDAIRAIFDRYELERAAVSPLVSPLSDDEVADLGELLSGEAPLAHLDPAQQLRLRRWGRVLLELLVG